MALKCANYFSCAFFFFSRKVIKNAIWLAIGAKIKNKQAKENL